MKLSFNASIYIAIINAAICHTPHVIRFKAAMLELDYDEDQEELINAVDYRLINAGFPNTFLKYLTLKHSNKTASTIHSIFYQQIWLLQYCCPMYIQNELLDWMLKWINDYNSSHKKV